MNHNSHSITAKLVSSTVLLTGAASTTYAILCPAEIAVAIGPYPFYLGIVAVFLGGVALVETIIRERN